MLYTYSYNSKKTHVFEETNIGVQITKTNRFVTLRSLCVYPRDIFRHISQNNWFVT